jgi:hypothetical protein
MKHLRCAAGVATLAVPHTTSKESVMEVFMVERSLKGIPMDQLAAAQQRAISTAKEMTAAGTPIRYIRSTFVPESGQCMCLFESQDEDTVKALNRKAEIPFNNVSVALDLTP